MPLVPPALGWLVGVLLGLFWPGAQAAGAGWAAGAAGLTGGALVLCWADRRARWAGLLLLALWLGLARTLLALPPATPLPGSLRAFNVPADQARSVIAPRQTVRGQAQADPDPTRSGQAAQLRVTVVQIQDGATWRPVHGGLLVIADRFVPAAQGDLVEVRGVVQEPPQVAGFDYPRWLRWHSIESYMDHGTVRVLQASDDATTLPATWRRAAGARTAAQLPEPAAGLLRGLLLGQQKAMNSALLVDFDKTQTSWLIVVSGSQITLLLVAIYWVSRRGLAPWSAVIVAGLVVLVYSLFVGFTLSVVRAALMGLSYLLAQGVGRPITPINLLGGGALVMTVFDPLSLGDLGFQLSFTAVAGILIFAPPLLAGWQRLPMLGPIFAVSVAAELGVTPVVLYHFGVWSPSGFVAGTLLSLSIAPLMILGTVYEVLAWIATALGQFIAWLCWLPLTLFAMAVHWAAYFPPVDVPNFGLFQVVVWYAILAFGYVMSSVDRRAAVRRFLRPDPAPPAAVGPRT